MGLVFSSALSTDSPALGVSDLGVDDGRTQCRHLPTVDKRSRGIDAMMLSYYYATLYSRCGGCADTTPILMLQRRVDDGLTKTTDTITVKTLLS